MDDHKVDTAKNRSGELLLFLSRSLHKAPSSCEQLQSQLIDNQKMTITVSMVARSILLSRATAVALVILGWSLN